MAPSGRATLLLLLAAAANMLGGQVLRRQTASSHAGSTVTCRLPLPLLLLLLLFLLPLLLVHSSLPGQFPAKVLQSDSKWRPNEMSGWCGK
jgi:hypothetical protein